MTPAVAPAVIPTLVRVLKPRLVSSLAGASGNPFRVWLPPESPVRIEYARELLRVLRLRHELGEAEEDAAGVLYGTRASGVVRVSSARPRSGLEPVGIFAARWRGEVFLTEQDIIRLETLENVNKVNDEPDSAVAIALVIAGGRAGFFVREPDGSMQTIQSYQEFPIRAPSPTTRAAQLTKLVRQLKFVKQVTRARLVKHAKLVKQSLPLALAAAAAVILSGCVLLPRSPPPFTVQERDGQLRIALTPSALSPGARLQIIDGQERRSIPISPPLTSVVYAPSTRDVHISIVH